jgi:hypothetical protein
MARSLTIRIVLALVMGLVIAFVPKGIIWVLFVAASGILVASGYSLVLRTRGRPSPIYGSVSPPWWSDLVLGFVAVVIIVSAVPGLFFDQPHWAIDHVYRAISLMLGNAA